MNSSHFVWLFLLLSGAIWSCNTDSKDALTSDEAALLVYHKADSLYRVSEVEALPLFRKLYKNIESYNQSQRVKIISGLAEGLFRNGKQDSSIMILSTEIDNTALLTDSLSILALRFVKAKHLLFTDKVKEAEKEYLICLKWAEALHSTKQILRAKVAFASVYSSNNQIGKSQKLYFQLIPDAKALNDSELLAIIYQNIGYNLGLRNEFRKAIPFQKIALSYHSFNPNSETCAELLNSIGANYKSINLLDSAINYLIASEIIFKRRNDPSGVIRSRFNQTNLKLKQGKLRDAEEGYLAVLEDARKYNIKIAEYYVLTALGDLETRKGNHQRALLLTDSAFQFLLKNNLMHLGLQLLINRAEIIEKAYGKDTSHPQWIKQKALSNIFNNPKEDSLLISISPNHSESGQTAKNNQASNSDNAYKLLFLVTGLLAVIGLLVVIFQRKRKKRIISARRMEVEAMAAVHRKEIEHLLYTAKNWQSTLFNAKSIRFETGLNEEDLQAVFQFLYGKSPEEQIQKLRVLHACELLEDPSTDLKLTEQLAESCGFDTVSAFYKAFVSVRGVQPGEYQKRKS